MRNRIVLGTLVALALASGLALAHRVEPEPATVAISAPAAPSLYTRLGGLPAISVVVSDFIDALVPDAELNRNPAIAQARARVSAAYLKFQVTALVCQATGGPCQYPGRGMKESHAHLHITPAEWDRMATIFEQILDRYAVPEAEQQELFAIVGSTRAEIVEEK